MPVPGWISKILSGGVGDIVEKVGNVADKFIQTKEEKDAFALEILKTKASIEQSTSELEARIEEAYLKDTQDARESYTKIQESEKASWLSKNIMPILTLVVTTGFFGLLGYMLKYTVPESNERIMDILLGSLGTAWVTMVGFYFGSSRSSEIKSDQIHKMINK